MAQPDRNAKIQRKTSETELDVHVDLDGAGQFSGSTGIGFMDHMLELMARHAGINLDIKGKGDLHVDGHHLVEDLGICLGRALRDAVGDKIGMARFGEASIPMEETLASCVLDFCDRPHLEFRVKLPQGKVGEFDIELTEDFFRALAMNAGMTLHLNLHYGRNGHHIIEALFKATARSIAQAVALDSNIKGVLSTKGKL